MNPRVLAICVHLPLSACHSTPAPSVSSQIAVNQRGLSERMQAASGASEGSHSDRESHDNLTQDPVDESAQARASVKAGAEERALSP